MPGSGWPTQNKLKFIFEVFLKMFLLHKAFYEILSSYGHFVYIIMVSNCVSSMDFCVCTTVSLPSYMFLGIFL